VNLFPPDSSPRNTKRMTKNFLKFSCVFRDKFPLLESINLTTTLFNHANSDFLHIIIAIFTGIIFLPHLEKESQPPLEYFFKMSISTYPLLWSIEVIELLCRGLHLLKLLIIAFYPANSMTFDSLSGTSKLFTSFRCPSSKALVYLAVVEMSAWPRVACKETKSPPLKEKRGQAKIWRKFGKKKREGRCVQMCKF
jgi:hypothetical protein